MLNSQMVPARNLQKSYKAIIDDVQTKNRTIVLTTNNKPRVAIVSLEDLEKLQQVKTAQGALGMLKLAIEAREDLKTLPADLRKQANKLLYTKK